MEFNSGFKGLMLWQLLCPAE